MEILVTPLRTPPTSSRWVPVRIENGRAYYRARNGRLFFQCLRTREWFRVTTTK